MQRVPRMWVRTTVTAACLPRHRAGLLRVCALLPAQSAFRPPDAHSSHRAGERGREGTKEESAQGLLQRDTAQSSSTHPCAALFANVAPTAASLLLPPSLAACTDRTPLGRRCCDRHPQLRRRCRHRRDCYTEPSARPTNTSTYERPCLRCQPPRSPCSPTAAIPLRTAAHHHRC